MTRQLAISNMVFLGVTGSHAYGTATRDSDVDVRGVCIPPRRVRESFYQTFEQWQGLHQSGADLPGEDALMQHPTAGPSYQHTQEIDVCIYSIVKFFRLAATNNPNILELLFLDSKDVLYTTEAWEAVRQHRDRFLSKRCRYTYAGYALSQLKRIRTHREWLLNPPEQKPTRKDFGLPETTVLPADTRNQIDEVVTKVIRGWGVEDGLDAYITGAAQDVLRERLANFQAETLRCSQDLLEDKLYELSAVSLGLTKETLFALKQERRYRSALKHYSQFQRWQRERNPARAELEKRHGYDTKHAMHLIRLLQTGYEILQGKGLQVRRDQIDSEVLMSIRNGAWSYDQITRETDMLQKQITLAVEASPLPDEPDVEFLDDILFRVLQV